MKKLLLPIVAVLCLAACNKAQYTVEGTSESQEGEMFLIALNNSQMDTLAKAPIKEGKFKMEGLVEKPTFAYLVTGGTRTAVPMLVENTATYKASISNDLGLSKVEGTPEQAILNDYSKINASAQQKAKEYYAERAAALQAKDNAKAMEIMQKVINLTNEVNEQENEFIKSNINSVAIVAAFANKASNMEFEEMKEIYDTMSEEIKNSAYGQEVTKVVKKFEAVEVGQVAPNFTLNTPDGEPLSMHDVKGKIKIIDFWASWCGPCRASNPMMVELYQKYQPKGLEILGISLDKDREKWLKAIEDDKLIWKHVSDLKFWSSEAADLYNVHSIPHVVILDENNTIISKGLHGAALKAKIEELMK